MIIESHVVIWDDSFDGHRREYLEFIQDSFGGQISTSLELRAVITALRAQRLVIGTLESSRLFPLVAAVRGLLGRPTTALTFRAHLLPASRISRALKALTFLALEALPPVRVFNVVASPPGESTPRAWRWIYDLQMFDVLTARLAAAPSSQLAARISDAASGRRIVVSPALQKASKGADVFLRMFVEHPALRESCLFVVGGRVDDALVPLAHEFAASGGFLEDRFLEQDEFLDLYRVADAVWCAYPPSQDMSSGVFGRAIQFGVGTIVRENSMLARAQAEVGAGVTIALTGGSEDAAKIIAMSADRFDTSSLISTLRDHTLRKLAQVIGNGRTSSRRGIDA